MSIYQTVISRRTVRDYTDEPVPEELVRKLLQAGRMAPSSSDSQPWHFVVVRDADTIARLGEIATQGPFLAGAPLVIAVCVVDDAPRGHLDAGRAIQQMEIVAWSEGLGTCFVGVRQAEQQVAVKELLGIPQEVELITLLPFGYRQEGFRRRGVRRKEMSTIAHRERFGTPW